MKPHMLCYICGIFAVVVLCLLFTFVFEPGWKLMRNEHRHGKPERKYEQNEFRNIITVEADSVCQCDSGCKEFKDNLRKTGSTPRNKSPDRSFFPGRNSSRVARRLAEVLELIGPLLCRLESERHRVLTQVRGWNLGQSRSRTMLRGPDRGYFQALGRISSVRTLTLEAPVSMVTDAIGDEEFQMTGNNCTLIEDTFYYQNYLDFRHLNNLTCQSNLSDSLIPRRIGSGRLQGAGLEGVPRGVGSERFNWSRLKEVPREIGSNNFVDTRRKQATSLKGAPKKIEFVLRKKRQSWKKQASNMNSSNVALTFIHVTTNGLVNRVGNILTNDVQLEVTGCPIARKSTDKSCSQPTEHYPLFKELFVVSQVWKGYYHVVIEQMSRLAPYICFLRKYPSIQIHMNIDDDFLGVVGDYFRILGLDRSRIVRGIARGQVVYAPGGTPCTNPPVFNIRLLSLWLRSSLPDSPQQGPRSSIVLIKRQVGRRRWFKFHSFIRNRLFELTRSDDEFILEELTDPVPPLHQVGELLSRAALVVAPHGAGLSNILFSEPGTVIVEGMCRVEFTAYCFRNLAAALGHRYYGVFTRNSCIELKADKLVNPAQFYLKLAKKFNKSARSEPETVKILKDDW